MSRSTQPLTRAHAAVFDFDVVTDMPPIPARKPQASAEAAPRADPNRVRETAKPAEA
jgi:hypothetical protein